MKAGGVVGRGPIRATEMGACLHADEYGEVKVDMADNLTYDTALVDGVTTPLSPKRQHVVATERRDGVSAEADEEDASSFVTPTYEKTAEQKEQVCRCGM